MTKNVIWRSPRCRLFFVTVFFVRIGHSRGGRIQHILQLSSMQRHKADPAISPLPGSEGPSCCLLGNLSCRWHLSCSRCPWPLGDLCSVDVPAGITVLSVKPWMPWQNGTALSRRGFPLSVALLPNSSMLATASTRGNPKFWSQLFWLVPSPPPFQAEEHQRVRGVGGLVWHRRDAGRHGGRKAGEGQATGTDSSVRPAPSSWCSHCMERKVFHFTRSLPLLPSKLRGDLLL